MVFFFTSRAPYNMVIYMGKDKFENEDLIKYGLNEDIWFHVDNLSSAHVYLRLEKGKTMDDIPADVLEDCAQLVKNNSISGVKEQVVTVIYTPWSNLKKTQGMEAGAVSFHDQKLVRKLKIEKKKEIVKAIEKTRTEKPVDLRAQREEYDRQLRTEDKKRKEEQRVKEQKEAEEKKKQQDLLNYVGFMDNNRMKSNKDADLEDLEDDFM
eukprot:TRINITY_DN10004_c0_g1_i1.p1 TRINITY_DN10004_c0_g1~~TRINITY_DN10004_c0_g1_i1.p1  ORF type:complete len:209 (-),score=90.00 TRINITY_DN10004_c0_g1_i1:26-652(-)